MDFMRTISLRLLGIGCVGGDGVNKTKEPTTGIDIFECPNCHNFDEIEVGKEGESFMAIMNAPYQYLRCAKCGFNEKKTHDDLSNNLKDSIEKWNKNVLALSDPNVKGTKDE